MNNLSADNKKIISLQSIYVALVIVFCVTPKELTLFSFDDTATRQYGSRITITIPLILTLGLVLLNARSLLVNRKTWRSPLIKFWIFGILSVIFAPFSGVEISYYLVVAYKFITYITIFLTITNLVGHSDFLNGLDLGCKLSLIIQTAAGWVYMLTGYLIPFFGNYSSSVRNGVPRMVGSFTHPGDFSLYVAIIFVYFAASFFYNGKRSSVVYMIIAALDIYFSGARTMLIISAAVVFVIILKRYRQNSLVRFSAVIVAVAGLYVFSQSDMFQDLFVTHNFYDMFVARFVHWIIGFRIFFDDIFTFLFGVGANSHVSYIDANYSDFSNLVSMASILDSDFVRGMPIHNSFLIVACEFGIFGIILYLSIYISSFKNVLHRSKNSSYRDSIYVFVISALGTYALYSIQGWAIMKNFAWTMLIIVIATLYHKNGMEDDVCDTIADK